MFYINTKTAVLRKISSGKTYNNTLTSAGVTTLEQDLHSLTITYIDKDGQIVRLPDKTTTKDQAAQKGGLCWYYASKIKRFGKFFMGQERHYEKIISDYRKVCTALTDTKAIEDAFVDHFNELLEKSNIQDAVSLSKDKILAQHILSNSVFKDPAIPNLLKSFLSSSESSDLTYFTLERQAKSIVAATTVASAQLQFDIKKAVSEALETDGKTANPEELDIDTLATYYDRALIRHIWQLQGYDTSSWHPAKGVEALIEELRNFICIAEIDYNLIKVGLGNPSHQFADQEDKGYLIYNVTQAEDEDSGEETHIIRIIGADLEHVYFIDPNDESPSNKPRIIHKIPYQLFCQILQDDYGFSVENSMSTKILPPVLHHITAESAGLIHPPSPKQRSKREHTPQMPRRTKVEEVEFKQASPTITKKEAFSPLLHKKPKIQDESHKNSPRWFRKKPNEQVATTAINSTPQKP
ncbi:hypothetical protein [Legionella cardiaca]|uniref:Dot/Icm T4SS effector n=1 Tax=Legionella cardiaca TaxID=1071983 RepID=A0ABY8AV93_9GAMM|nr:hypothetical protein [Legionella cardiaca]WED43326.1 hypothetical protein PXX05_00710 [Legionella cardiaca]